MTVSTTSSCSWTSSSSDSWITVTGGGSGSGNGSVSYTVSSNPTTQSRSGNITVEGEVVTIDQDGLPCTYALSSGNASFGFAAGSSSVGMTSLAGCNWSATSSQSWVTITAGASGSGNGTISYSVASNPTIQARSATITAGGQVLNITQDGIPCTYSLSPGSANFDSNGGGGSVGMTSPTGCAWTASSSDGWITITAEASGSGNGTISYSVASNPTIQSRSGTITAGGQVFSITQDGIVCTYSLSPGSANFDSNGGAGSVGMTSPTGCSWTASTSDGWITVTSGASGSGSGTITYMVASNPTIQTRSGSITATGQTLTITQTGIDCTYSLSSSSASFDSDGGGGSVGMTSPSGCSWSASSSESWITITAGASGSGDGSLSYTVDSNSTIQTRSGTITAAGQTLTITQSGINCTFELSSNNASFDSDGGSASVDLTSPAGCSWTASSNESWITITTGVSGSGDGAIAYTVDSNSTIQTRSGTITVAGQTLAITQSGIDCSFDLSSNSASFDSDGGSASVDLTSPAGCSWTASSNESWITITTGVSGSGDGAIAYTVDSNSTIQTRSGTITVAGQTLAITQSGIDCTFQLSSNSASFDSDGGSGSVSATSPSGCAWAANSSDAWISISEGGLGNGNGSLSFTVAPNTTIESRSGTIVVEDQVLTITQSRIDCSYSLSPSSASFDSEGGSSGTSVSSPDGCQWSASSSDSWTSITSGGSGSGDGPVSFTVAANTTIQARSGSLTVGGQDFNITQDGIPCSYSLSPGVGSFDADGGSSSTSVSSPDGCEWSASSSESWITISSGASGNGDDSVSFTVAANDTIQSRSGTIMLEGQVLTITQDGIECTYSLSSGSASFDSGGGSGSIDLTSPTGCSWTASSSESWITISAGANGSGDGSVSFAVAANNTIQSRAGVVTAGGQVLTITQGGIDCTYSLSLQSASFDFGGGSSSVSVTSPDGCEWSASSNDSWITITAGAGGSGDGPVSFAVAANTSIQSRSGSVMVGGQGFTITQDGITCSYSLTSVSASFDAEGGSGSVGVTSPAGCDWSASNEDSWITINGEPSGSGDSSISFAAAANATIFPRSGTITVEGQVLTIAQEGIDCSYSLSSGGASFGADGGSSSVSVSSPDGCEWSASSSGDGSVSFTVTANSTIESRSGTIMVEGEVLTITQGGIDCTYSLSPSTASLGSEGGNSGLEVSSPEGCEWSASSSESWITISSGGSGSGSGSVSFTVDYYNTTIQSRSGTIVAGGQVFTITQDGISCTYTLSSSNLSLDAEGGISSIGVSSPDGCEWSASSNESWIIMGVGSSGSGSGNTSFTVSANETIQSRSGTVVVEG